MAKVQIGLVDLSGAAPFQPLIDQSQFPTVAVLFMTLGFALSSYLLMYEASHSKGSSWTRELIVSIPSSLVLGIGLLFSLQAAGIYV